MNCNESSPLAKLPVMAIVALVMFALSTSLTVIALSIMSGDPFSVKVTVLPVVNTGASSTEITFTVLVIVLESKVPSFTVKEMVRDAVLGFSELLEYVMDSNAV